ncbi:MAG: chemotaxis protein CheW [Blastochloris sp.]|nr:chemotaxis protein CheW [Blastochloris sp.]
MELCLFKLNQADYGIPMSSVREVLSRPRLSPVPLAPATLRGMTHFRGEVLPVFSLDSLFNSSQTPPVTPVQDHSRVLVLTHSGQLLGLHVDQVDELSLPPGQSGDFWTQDSSELLGPLIPHLARHFQPLHIPGLFHTLQHSLSSIRLSFFQPTNPTPA